MMDTARRTMPLKVVSSFQINRGLAVCVDIDERDTHDYAPNDVLVDEIGGAWKIRGIESFCIQPPKPTGIWHLKPLREGQEDPPEGSTLTKAAFTE